MSPFGSSRAPDNTVEAMPVMARLLLPSCESQVSTGTFACPGYMKLEGEMESLEHSLRPGSLTLKGRREMEEGSWRKLLLL